MSYCRYCGREISYTRTINGKWLPYDVTGNPHFCNKTKNNKLDKRNKFGLLVCTKCGKPVFKDKDKIIDYSSLSVHICKTADITRFTKYKKVLKARKKEIEISK